MRVTRRQLLASGGVVLAGAAVGLAARPSVRTTLAADLRRAESKVTRSSSAQASASAPTSVTINVDPSRVLRPISPLIYGVAHANPDQLVALGAQLNRWGGNPNTRYNWVANAWNAARDWEFRNYGDDPAQVEAPGFSADQFVANSQGVGAETVFTIPAIGWVASNRDKSVQSVGVPSNGGPALSGGSDAISGYDPTDNRRRTSVPSFARRDTTRAQPDGAVYQDEFLRHLVTRFGAADGGGVRYYIVDNEPDLWSSTHTDVHPVQMSYDDMLATFTEYARAIKSVDPAASVAGPAVSGWTSLLYSARDRGSDNFHTHADRAAHGDVPFLPWWLDAVRKQDEQFGARTLDVLDVHYYPQASGVYSNSDDVATHALRLRSTRGLWDASYADESWINDKVRLIPRLREWIDQYYPGTRLAIGEWNWGGEKAISGALAIADVLGIFGREGVDMATYWTFPPVDSPGAQAFTLFTHYNAQGDGFGDQAILTSTDASADDATAYASLDSSTGDIILVVINKLAAGALPATLTISGVSNGTADVYAFAEGDASIRRIGGASITNSSMTMNLPATSMSVIRIARG